MENNHYSTIIPIASVTLLGLLGTFRFIQCGRYKHAVENANFHPSISRQIKERYSDGTEINSMFYNLATSILAAGSITFMGLIGANIINNETLGIASGIFAGSSLPLLTVLCAMFLRQKNFKDEAMSQAISESTSASV